jgi:hypothetical protein
MQLPTIDRTPNLRPAGAEVASSGANRVIPIAPVNPISSASTAAPFANSAGPSPSAIDLVNPALKPNGTAQPQTAPPTEGEPVYTSVVDPSKRSSQVALAPRDWTIHRPAPEKVENPPPKPMSQVLMDHLRTMWTASASAIQIEQVKNQLTPSEPLAPTQVPGDLAKEVLTYAPSKIKKTENI